MHLFDPTKDCALWLNSDNLAKSFTEWILKAPPWIQMGYSGMGSKPGDNEWDEFAQQRLSKLSQVQHPLSALLKEGTWKKPAKWTIKRTEKLLGGQISYVDIVVSVGLGARNASMGLWQGKGLAFLWLEHFLKPGSNSGYLDLGISSIPIWLGHEIAHAIRYATPGTKSLIPEACANCDPWSFWERLEKLPLGERFLDEGLSTEFAKAIVPDANDQQALGMSKMEIGWLEENGEKLLKDRLKRWDFNAWNPSMEWIIESLCYDLDRVKPPWTLDRPPGRWGYFVGQRFFARHFQGDWLRKLTQSYESIVDR
jgi:hypothetical protein